jgi:hypothetical protein
MKDFFVISFKLTFLAKSDSTRGTVPPPTVICATVAVQASQWRLVMGKNGALLQ